MSKIEITKRYSLFVISLFFSAVGVAFTKQAGLGVSPISSVANVLSCKFTFLTLGYWLIIWNCMLILGQIILLRKKFQLIQLLQIPLSFLFGIFTDLAMTMTNSLPLDSYVFKLVWVVVGIFILSFGIALSVIANVIMNSGEAFVKAISDISGKEFGTIKVIWDVTCVIAAVVLSLVLFKFQIVGTREGTIITAIMTGFVVKGYDRLLAKPVSRILCDTEEEAELQAHTVITISREYGSGGREIGRRVAKSLGLEFYDLDRIWEETEGIDREASVEEKAELLQRIANDKSCVIVGRMPHFLLDNDTSSYDIYIGASTKSKLKRIVSRDKLSPVEAGHKLRKVDRECVNKCKMFTDRDWDDSRNYDMQVKSDEVGVKKTAAMIVETIKEDNKSKTA